LDEFLQVCIHSLLQPKDNEKYDEASSSHVMIYVMILLIWGENKKNTDRGESPVGSVGC